MKTEYTFIVDFSFDNEKVTIFEMGDYFTSSLSRLNQLRFKDGKDTFEKEHMRQLRAANSDVIYLEINGSSISFRDFTINHHETYDTDDTGAPYAVESLLVSRGILGKQKKICRPVIVSLDFLPTLYSRAILSTLHQPDFKLLNYPKGVLREATRDKAVLHAFTHESSICPDTLLIDLRGDDLNVKLDAFFAQNKATRYVIKPTSLTQSMAVSVVSEDEARHLVRKLVKSIYVGSSIDPGMWLYNFKHGNYFALLQTCVPSKEIIFENKAYRPTGRAVITATFHDEHALPELTYHGSYWELPSQSVDECWTTASLVSPDNYNKRCVVLPIEPSDWIKIEEDINQRLPAILLEMYHTSLVQLKDKLNVSPEMRAYSTYLSLDKLPVGRPPLIQDNLEEAISNRFETFKYCSSNKQNPGYFKNAMIAYPGYIEHVTPSKQTYVAPSELSTQTIKNNGEIGDQKIKYQKINYQAHGDSIHLLSRYNNPLLAPFLFYTGVLALAGWAITKHSGLLAYGIFGLVTSSCVSNDASQKLKP